MNCTICGAIVPDGQTNCPMCGAPIQADKPADNVQPQQSVNAQMGYQQPTGQPAQPQMGYQQPMGQPVQPQMGYQQPMGQPVQPQMGYQQPIGQPAQPQMGYQQPMGQPVQPQMGYQQPMGGYYQPQSGGMNAFINNLKGDYMMIARLAGAFLLLIAPLFHWFSFKLKYDGSTEKQTANMFKLAGDGGVGVYGFFAAMFILLGLVLIAWEIADYIPALANIKEKMKVVPYVDLIIIAVALLFVILAATNGMKGNMKDAKDSIKLIKEWSDGVKGHCNHGVGPIIGFIAVIAAAAPRVLDKLGIKIGNK